jgi:chemotaxis protein MotB
MFSRTAPQTESEEAKDVFAPVADLMVGVVFIFIVLMLALVMLARDEQTVPLSRYQEAQKQLREVQTERDSAILRLRSLEADNALLAQRLSEEIEQHTAAQMRERALREEISRLLDFLRFLKDNNLPRILQGLSEVGRAREEALVEIRNLLEQDGIRVAIDPATGTLRLPASQLFLQGSTIPTEAGREVIRTLARAMARVLPCYAAEASARPPHCITRAEGSLLSAVYIEGHTDIAPLNRTSFPRDNWDLSAARAIAAFQLVNAEAEALRSLRNRDGDLLMGVSGYADVRPADRNQRAQLQRRVEDSDRRIEIRVVMATNDSFVLSLIDELNERMRQVDDLLQQR